MTPKDEQLTREPKFGDMVRGVFASESNPIRDGMYVETIRRTGRMNPGKFYRLTDGKGKFWEFPAQHTIPLDQPATQDDSSGDRAGGSKAALFTEYVHGRSDGFDAGLVKAADICRRNANRWADLRGSYARSDAELAARCRGDESQACADKISQIISGSTPNPASEPNPSVALWERWREDVKAAATSLLPASRESAPRHWEAYEAAWSMREFVVKQLIERIDALPQPQAQDAQPAARSHGPAASAERQPSSPESASHSQGSDAHIQANEGLNPSGSALSSEPDRAGVIESFAVHQRCSEGCEVGDVRGAQKRCVYECAVLKLEGR